MSPLDLEKLTPEQRAMVDLWEAHLKAELQDKDAHASCDTMVANPSFSKRESSTQPLDEQAAPSQKKKKAQQGANVALGKTRLRVERTGGSLGRTFRRAGRV